MEKIKLENIFYLDVAMAYFYFMDNDTQVNDELLKLNSEYLANLHPNRKKEFINGRFCLYMAGKKINTNLSNVPIDKNGSLGLPQGLCASLTHKDNYTIAVTSKVLKSVGVDIEKIMSKERFERIKTRFCSENELQIVSNELDGTITFSLKESLYKLIFPLAQQYFGFLSAEILEINHDYNTFKVLLKSNQEKIAKYNALYKGQFYKIDNYIITYLDFL